MYDNFKVRQAEIIDSMTEEINDKLMKALKRESGKTIKALEDNRQIEKQTFTLTQKIEKQAKVISVQNR